MNRTRHVVLIHGAWSRGTELTTARAAFEVRGYTAHTPTLRHHELPIDDGSSKIATLSLRDYTEDLVALVNSLDSPPLLVGHSLGGLLVQLVAARTHHVGVVAACPSPVGSPGLNATTLRISRRHTHLRPWARPVHPPPWEVFRAAVCGAQTEEQARELFDHLVCESGRVLFFELATPWLDRAKSAVVDFSAVTTPVLAVAGEHDRIVSARNVCRAAGQYQHGTFTEIPKSDHLVFSGRALAATMERIDRWVSANHLFACQ